MKKLSFLAILLALCVAGWAQGPDNAPPPDQPQGRQESGGQRGGRRGGPGLIGEVTAISGNTITVKTMDGNTATVNVTDQTRFRKDRQDAKLTDVKVGDNVFVRGQKGSDGSVQAEMVAVPPAGMMGNMRDGLGKNFIMGEIKSINGTQIEIARPDGQTQTIAVDENTSFHKNRESVTLADFKAGDRVFGRGEVKNNVFVAATLNEGQPGMGRSPRMGGGEGPPPQQ
jgi:preprotein translocase subunit YajC